MFSNLPHRVCLQTGLVALIHNFFIMGFVITWALVMISVFFITSDVLVVWVLEGGGENNFLLIVRQDVFVWLMNSVHF